MAKGSKSPIPAEPCWSIPKRVLNSCAYRAIGYSSRALLIDLITQFNGYNNGDICASLGLLAKRGWSSSSTIAKCIRDLLRVGLIEKTRQGGIASMSQICNLYRFTFWPVVRDYPDKGISRHRATNEFERFSTVEHARKALDASNRFKPKDMKVQKLAPAASKIEGIDALKDSTFEAMEIR